MFKLFLTSTFGILFFALNANTVLAQETSNMTPCSELGINVTDGLNTDFGVDSEEAHRLSVQTGPQFSQLEQYDDFRFEVYSGTGITDLFRRAESDWIPSNEFTQSGILITTIDNPLGSGWALTPSDEYRYVFVYGSYYRSIWGMQTPVWTTEPICFAGHYARKVADPDEPAVIADPPSSPNNENQPPTQPGAMPGAEAPQQPGEPPPPLTTPPSSAPPSDIPGGNRPTQPTTTPTTPTESGDFSSSDDAGGGLNIFGPDDAAFRELNPLPDNEVGRTLSSPGGIVSRILVFAFPLAGLILFAMIVWGGFEMLTSATSSKGVDAGRQRVTNAIIGFIILFSSYWIIQIVQVVFGVAIL